MPGDDVDCSKGCLRVTAAADLLHRQDRSLSPFEWAERVEQDARRRQKEAQLGEFLARMGSGTQKSAA